MRVLILSLLLIFAVSQRGRKNRNPVGAVNVTKAEYYRSKNLTDNHVEQILKLDIPSKVKEWVKKANLNKSNTGKNINVKYNVSEGGSATGELYIYRKRGFKNRTEVEFNYGTAVAKLKPLRPEVVKRCHGFGKNKKCHNVTIPVRISESEVKNMVETKMRNEINQVIKRKIFNKNKTKNKTK
jgi:hypothetical protein